MLFEDIPLREEIHNQLKSLGFQEATPIQRESIPPALAGKDLIACAKTGSGKTLAFLIPIYEKFLKSNEGISALVLAPTRELVIQIKDEALRLGMENVAAIYGGEGYEKQKLALKQNPALIVATPGRLLDFLRSQTISVQRIKTVVLDEADRMLDMGFLDDVKTILRQIPIEQISLFSATLNYEAMYSVWEFMKDPVEIFVNPEQITHEKIQQSLIHLAREEKLPYITLYLKEENQFPVILFSNTKHIIPQIAATLRANGIAAEGLSSVLSQAKRKKVLEGFKQGKFQVLVATDVASRGIHIDDVKLVVNFDIPQDPENYVHRIGRTARAGKEGRSLSICSEADYMELEKLESYLKYKIPVEQPRDELLAKLNEVTIPKTRLNQKTHRTRHTDRHKHKMKPYKQKARVKASIPRKHPRKRGAVRKKENRTTPQVKKQVLQVPAYPAATMPRTVLTKAKKPSFFTRLKKLFRKS
ncbi:MAG: DEAD/DEAH box helicase [Candidatus Hydrogenedentota bacterium]|nr:MAG: DEAD/DEAH box helicase [Candidatus Hydrogenedentota bacterium]